MTSEKNKKNVTQNATKQEIGAALKLFGLLYEQGEIMVYVQSLAVPFDAFLVEFAERS